MRGRPPPRLMRAPYSHLEDERLVYASIAGKYSPATVYYRSNSIVSKFSSHLGAPLVCFVREVPDN